MIPVVGCIKNSSVKSVRHQPIILAVTFILNIAHEERSVHTQDAKAANDLTTDAELSSDLMALVPPTGNSVSLVPRPPPHC